MKHVQEYSEHKDQLA